ncbi:MAG: C-GCAxxG-C-C family protein [Proteobacteria bacterium]|nr:C-GCAxxG-C-C family protein [Pseudomonadota bacterium]MBU4471343.1 C-GCAxxG-C-C family protein [Pseudomonadota bacterium]MCG2751654.1 C-GCAxxG-C-C family protein [Desulfobacteraceae bacterium]
MKDDNYLWSGIHFMGGISGDNRGTCGAVSGAAICQGLRHRCSLAPENKEQAKSARNKSRVQAGTLIKEFGEKFGHVACQELLQIDFSVPGAYQEFRSSGIAEKKCYEYVYFLVDKLYSFENEEDSSSVG